MSSTVKFEDVLNTSPQEDKGETRLMSSIDEEQPDEGHEEHSLQLGDETDSDDESSVQSMEEEMYSLTNEMRSVVGKKPSKKRNSKQTDSFAHNASKLVGKASRPANRVTGTEARTYQQFKSFLAFRRDSMTLYARFALVYAILPGVGLACLSFYAFDNTGTEEKASFSWWILFVVVRLVLTLSLAKAAEAVVVDFCCIRTRVSMRLFGPFFSLLLTQSKGWPFQLLAWGVFNFAMLYGRGDFPRHWLFYQNILDVFNKKNSAGNVTEAVAWRNIIICFVVVGGFVSLKRFFVGLWYSQSVYNRYGKKLTNVLSRAVLVSHIAAFSRGKAMSRAPELDELASSKLAAITASMSDDGVGDGDNGNDDLTSSNLLIDTKRRDLYSGNLSASQKVKIQDLLGEFEDPATDDQKGESPSISAIVQFQNAVSCIDKVFPFSSDFGRADKRDACIASSQNLFLRLTRRESDTSTLKFDTIVAIAMKKDGTLNEEKVVEMINVFRPTRSGEITMLDFVKSIDAIYKELRIIRVSIANAQKMNLASQKLLNIAFYFCLACIVLAILGLNPVAIFGALATIVIGLALMVGDATSKYFEGLLLVLVRKPYDIGDRIAVSEVNGDTDDDGSAGWIVKDLNLFTTTVIFGTTGEEATYSNASLVDSRIINHNRSPKGVLSFAVRFRIDVEKSKIHTYGEALRQFVKDRPREWNTFNRFSLALVEPGEGFLEYRVVVQHRESWQQAGALMRSKADLQLFAYELSTEMGMGCEEST